jgi:hypothetical protein
MALKKPVRQVVTKVRKVARKRLSAAEIKRQSQLVREAIKEHRQERRFERFESIADEDIAKKLRRVNTPFINSIGWGNLPSGGSMLLSVGVFNPDPVASGAMWILVFVGPAFAVADDGIALLNVDARFNRLAGPDGGMVLAPSASSSATFTFRAPAGIDKSDYICNLFLTRLLVFDAGSVLDRAAIDVAVV